MRYVSVELVRCTPVVICGTLWNRRNIYRRSSARPALRHRPYCQSIPRCVSHAHGSDHGNLGAYDEEKRFSREDFVCSCTRKAISRRGFCFSSAAKAISRTAFRFSSTGKAISRTAFCFSSAGKRFPGKSWGVNGSYALRMTIHAHSPDTGTFHERKIYAREIRISVVDCRCRRPYVDRNSWSARPPDCPPRNDAHRRQRRCDAQCKYRRSRATYHAD